MRLFVGEPVWKAYNRPADDYEMRKKYMASLQEAWKSTRLQSAIWDLWSEHDSEITHFHVPQDAITLHKLKVGVSNLCRGAAGDQAVSSSKNGFKYSKKHN